jgi:hypothetical protein
VRERRGLTPGAQIGQLAGAAWLGTTSHPEGLVLSGAQMLGAQQTLVRACNVTNGALSTPPGFQLRVVTFG